MTTREKVLELFEKNKGIYFSGEEIAKELSVSRAAVWKAVNALRKEGYSIDAVTNKGYCLSEKTDILSPQGIQKYLHSGSIPMDITVLSTIDSTNVWIKEKAAQGFKEGCTVISNEQTHGRGRYERTFFSPSETGIYMSLLLRPQNCSSAQAVKLTAMTAVAICEAIEEVSNKEAQIKWVNDIYVNNKKVCGILTEASFNLESGLLEYAVIGIGINVYPPKEGFPAKICKTAGSIFSFAQDDLKNRLTASFLNHFMKYYTDFSCSGNTPATLSDTSLIEKYRSRNIAVGKEITILSGKQSRRAFAYGIDDSYHLLVKYDNGEKESLSYGEISISL